MQLLRTLQRELAAQLTPSLNSKWFVVTTKLWPAAVSVSFSGQFCV